MAKLTILIGLPASGKSTYAKQLSKENNAVIHSSDELRIELFGSVSTFDKNDELFKELHKRVINDLKNGCNVIYDATNLNWKKRRNFLSKVPINVERQAIVVATSVGSCLVRDDKRKRHVGSKRILGMWRNFNFPLEQEGFDEISIHYTEDIDFSRNFNNYYQACNQFEQDNKNHLYKLGKHMLTSTTSYIGTEENPNHLLAYVLFFHDIGKLWTKSFKNKRGIVGTEAHYYSHQNVSAYQTMFLLAEIDERGNSINLIHILQLIQWHMQPYFIGNEKNNKKWLDFFGEMMYNEIMVVNKYDILGH